MADERTAAQPAAPSPTPCPWTDAVVGNLIRENVGDTFMEEYSNRMRVHARSLERLVHMQQAKIVSICVAVSQDDWRTFDAEYGEAQAAYAALKKEIERG